jgi:hypothetical protein
MLPLKLAGGICLSALALAASSAAQKTINSFKPIATVGVPNGVAEIVDATDDGMKLLYSDSSASNIGVVDLTTPSAPKLLGTVPVSGEPTSVSILGNYAVATVWADLKEEGKPAPKFTAGKLYVMDLSGSGLPKVLGTIDLGWHPDSVKLTKIGNDLVAVVAIENEPCILDGNNLVTDDDIPGHPNDVSPAGFIQVVTIDTANLANSTVAKVDLTSATLQAAGCQFENDPQPEFVVTHGTTAAVTLQENNGVAIVDNRHADEPQARPRLQHGRCRRAHHRPDRGRADPVRRGLPELAREHEPPPQGWRRSHAARRPALRRRADLHARRPVRRHGR